MALTWTRTEKFFGIFDRKFRCSVDIPTSEKSLFEKSSPFRYVSVKKFILVYAITTSTPNNLRFFPDDPDGQIHGFLFKGGLKNIISHKNYYTIKIKSQ